MNFFFFFFFFFFWGGGGSPWLKEEVITLRKDLGHVLNTKCRIFGKSPSSGRRL